MGKEKEMSEKKNKSSMLTGRIGTFKGKKYNEKPTDYVKKKEKITGRIGTFKGKKYNEKPTDYIKKRTGSGASGTPIRLKDITGRPDPAKKNYMAGGMVNPSYGTEFDDR
jgi:hypothetical protein